MPRVTLGNLGSLMVQFRSFFLLFTILKINGLKIKTVVFICVVYNGLSENMCTCNGDNKCCNTVILTQSKKCLFC